MSSIDRCVGEASSTCAVLGTPARNAPARKRKRRILSCDACRRLKCRCDLGEGSDTCARCRALRIPCVKSDDHDQPATQNDGHAPAEFSTRLLQLESSVLSIKSTLETLRSEREQPGETMTDNSPVQVEQPSTEEDPDIDDVEPVDQHVNASPAEVMRKVARQLSMGYRRTVDIYDDVVSLELLDVATASYLVTSFISRRRHVLLIDSEGDLSSTGNLRNDSPFLFSVCCLLEMRQSPLAEGDPVKHRLVYEHVRQMLGQVMLASPLRIEEITGILIMAIFAFSPSNGPEYLDSWLLSGHCAQQAMLSISFSEIMTRLSLSTSTTADQKSVRLWANICLANLHWSATTGRPSILPPSYLRQCRILLNFEQATMRDGMLFAEIALYSMLEQRCSRKSYMKLDGSHGGFEEWRQKWSYLLDLSTSWRLKISHRIAHLILARQSLDHTTRDKDHESVRHNTDDRDCPNLIKAMQALVSESALQVIVIFVSTPKSSCDDLPEFYKLCIAYSVLILSLYEPKPSTISHAEIFQHLEEVQKRCDESQASSLALRFSLERALKRFRNTDYSKDDPERNTELQSPALDNIETDFSEETPYSINVGLNILEDMDVFLSEGCLNSEVE
ncbi:hypothetical protein BGZ61DRAFT_462270 [Ilyonectria robusta]|uniref:uncharacterized protein n=1 Tax=Ilyonectria robusta TaxID=1079257 RepID=UPI001E8D6705|nr:uncharacterized protein BGZ61DRAFT_462270 [Ilyonectria robusta]KAH8665429.1 hypothetical protein BGZ61DRAFT_462270 [Ilyonectria robusta]